MSASRITAALVLGAALAAAGCSSSTSQPSAGISAIASTPPAAHHAATAAALAGDLKAAGLPVRHLIVYTATTDPNHMMGRQGGYTSKVEWRDPRAVKAAGGLGSGVDNGGSIEVYPTAAGAQTRTVYLRQISSAVQIVADGYDYRSGTAVLRLSRYLTPAQARTYKAAFTAAVQD